MNVVHIEAGRHLYGGAAQVALLLRGLRELQRPDRHVLICPTGSAIAQMAASWVDALYPIAMGGDLDLTLVPRLRRILRQQKPDLVHLHSRRGADTWGALAARLEGIPAVLSRRVDNPEKRWLAPWKYRLYRRVITISAGIRRVLIEQAGVAPDQVVCVPSAVDTERFQPGGDKHWLRREWGLLPEDIAIGMIAQFIERKGHRLLIDALPAIWQRHPRARFLLFGQGPLEKSIQALCAERSWQDRVVFAGFRQDLERVLPSLDLLLHPALMEGLGVALLEAAACGLAIVASRVGGIPEIVRDGSNGVLIPPGDAAALASAVNALLDDPQRRALYGARGRQRVLEEFSVPAMVAGNYRVYREVLGLDANR